jgi:excisionase family DNA binding protein
MLTKKELSEHFKVSESTINRLLNQGMPYTRIGNQVRFDLDEVKEWLEITKEG